MFFAKIAANGDSLYVKRSNMTGEDIGYKVGLNIHSTNDVFYVNIAGISNANPTSGSFIGATFTLVASTITVTSHISFNTQTNIVSITAGPSLVSITPNSPDNDDGRAMVLKFDPPSVQSKIKMALHTHLTY
jgi:hypothetical protein